MFSGSRLPRSSRNAFDYRYLSAHEDALNVRAVWHLDKFVAQNARALRHVHLFPADSAVRRILILGDGFLVCNDFI
jgi:hypothetical protein